jgi:hypothetical protein
LITFGVAIFTDIALRCAICFLFSLVVDISIIGGRSDISPVGGRVLTYDIGLEHSPKLPLFRWTILLCCPSSVASVSLYI